MSLVSSSARVLPGLLVAQLFLCGAKKLKAEDLPIFAHHVAHSGVEHLKAFLETANAHGHLRKVDVSPEALKGLLARGKSIRMAVLMPLANHYRRAKAWIEKKQQTASSGALSDTRILGESAYAPKVRLWECRLSL
jgi:hypothetical protein